jgi:hypothetical protein
MQRYDYLVRTRPLTPPERAAWEARRNQHGQPQLSDYKRALLAALRTLTGKDAGITTADWQRVLQEDAAVEQAERTWPVWRNRYCAR